ncbi:uncharacterized protein XM38_025320 [Halomicronema hongdechloris C2206]|uniref:Right handed beta helix domain-containing protein n=1 Tax=Halomicronema hongdechloris C2206 TaxID=1641165 RepID=A0A1Z3HMR1_9CYAN|nr:right-handed parallel beta-helix repeat-containing protein [Halomicronema hongdechloris]ASC71580.1 uncharacterized protein XM38_025320 [Halomicronema hongdechloris C2206]
MNTIPRTYYVSPNGNNNNPGTEAQPWKDIRYATSQESPVQAGDTILVQSGTYTETITLEKSGSNQQGHITLKANDNVILRDPQPNQGGFREGVIQSAGKGYWVIDGFRIENTSWAGIALRDANNMVVQNNHTDNTGASGIIVMPDKFFGGGEAEVTSSDIKILNNIVERANWKWQTANDTGAPQEALTIWGVDGFEVAGNLVRDTKKEGIDIKTGSRNGSVHDNRVTRTALISGTPAGYRGGPAIYVDGNRADTFNIAIYNNVVHNNTSSGIVIADEVVGVGDVADIRVYNNVIYDNGRLGINAGAGISVRHNVEDVNIINNTLSGNVQAFLVDGASASGNPKLEDVLIRNNIFADSVFRNGFIGAAEDITIDNNLFTNDFDVLYQLGTVTDLHDSANDVVASVGFVDAQNQDFRLSASSAAVDSGSNQIGNYAQTDFNGVLRPNGAGVDQGAYEFLPHNKSTTIGEYDTLDLNHQWQTILLDESYINPVVIVSDPTLNGSDPAAIRLRKVTQDSFQIRLQEPNYKDGKHINESVSYLVIEAGDWTLADGTRISAGQHQSDRLTSKGFDAIDLTGFDSTPAVLSQVQTFNGSDWVTTRTTGQSANGFQLAMQEEEARNNGGHVDETIGWLAVSQGVASDGDTLLQGNTTGRNYDHNQATVNFDADFNTAPSVLAKLGSYFGPDTANLRLDDITANGFSLGVYEEQSLNQELLHTQESVSFLALEGPAGVLTGLPF